MDDTSGTSGGRRNDRSAPECRRWLKPLVFALGLACLPAGADAQIFNPNSPDLDAGVTWQYLYLREASPIDNPNPFLLSSQTPSRLRPTAAISDLLSPRFDPCTNAWTSGSYLQLGSPADWSYGPIEPYAPGPGVIPVNPPVWIPVQVDLSQFAGQAVAIAFEFRTDRFANNHEGVYVDVIRLGPLADPVVGQFANGAEAGEQGQMLLLNSRQSTGWRATAPPAHAAEGQSSWWFGNPATGTYEASPDPAPGDVCEDAESRGWLMTPVVRLGASPTLDFKLRFSVPFSVFEEDWFDVIALRDLDEDGLIDYWERKGFADQNHNFFFDGSDVALSGANWKRKDVYVEIDYMAADQDHSDGPVHGVLNLLEGVFDRLPVSNP